MHDLFGVILDNLPTDRIHKAEGIIMKRLSCGVDDTDTVSFELKSTRHRASSPSKQKPNVLLIGAQQRDGEMILRWLQ